MISSADSVCYVTAKLPPEVVGALFEVIDADGFSPTSWHDVETGLCRVDLFPDPGVDVEAVRSALLDAAALVGVALKPEVATLAKSDWAESWKRFFHVEKVSERVVVRPSWEPYAARPGERVITLDPGLSFGTGKHATTQACLLFLDRLAAEDVRRSVLDMGCGSGILAIGARLLGFENVRGFDNDPDCIQVSNENAAPVLIQFAPQVAGSLAAGPQARLVVSGILDEQYAAVRAAYCAQGLAEVESLLIENWRSGLFRHGAAT